MRAKATTGTFVLVHPTEYDITFDVRGPVVVVTEDDDPPVELPLATARGLWRAAVAQGYMELPQFPTDDELEEMAEDYAAERWAEAYNDARMFGWDHNDALAAAGGYA